ncbi:hypothetical protein JTB14_033688 [Gonioctena quinquepunctata]|nr:hypothetical protein JTB14_033688 [Gonioctena quinquepunctata]
MFKEGIMEMMSHADKNIKPKHNYLYVEATSPLVSEMNRGVTLPICYEVLLIIFFYTNQTFRQHHFHELITHYYITMEEHKSTAELLPRDMFENIVYNLLPFVKLDILYILFRTWSFDNSFIAIKTLLEELHEYASCPNLLREDCFKILTDDLESTNFELLHYELTKLKEVPGYLGDYYLVKITFSFENETNCYQMFAKYFPTTIDTAKMDMVRETPKKEAFIYRTFVPKLMELGLQGISDFSPKCYFIRTNDVLILEDLSVSQYTSADIATLGCYEWLSAVIGTLAKFHACSLLLEEKLETMTGSVSRLGDIYAEFLQEIAWSKEGASGALNKCSIRTTIEFILEKFLDIPKKISLEQFKKRATAAFDLMYKQMERSEIYRNVISHGDIWASNIMTKYNKPVSCYIIDYQLIKYCPPTVDLLTFIYMHTSKETRMKYKQKLMDDYYEHLVDIFERYNYNIDEIYSYGTFLKCCEEFQSTAICQAIVCVQTLLLPKDILKKLLITEEDVYKFYTVDRSEVYEKVFEQDRAYKIRIEHLIEDLYDVCENSL